MFGSVGKLITREAAQCLKSNMSQCKATRAKSVFTLSVRSSSTNNRMNYHALMHQEEEQEVPQQLTTTRVHAYPRVCLHDVPTKLGATGLKPHVPVTFKLSTRDFKGIEFSSIGHYFTDNHGKVDISNFESFGGSYIGVFPAGLLTTLEPPANNPYKRLTCVNAAEPIKMTLSVYEGHRTKEDCHSAVSEEELERHYLGPGVKRIEVEEGRVRGALYIPQGPGPHPAVIDMFGASTILSEHRSAMLASRGIMSLALPFFGYRDLPKSLRTMKLEYFEEAVDYLLSQPTAIPDRCGVISTCQGGAIGLSMGVFIDKVKAVFAINANTCLYESTLTKNGSPVLKGHKLSSDDLVFDDKYRGKINWEIARNKFMGVDNPMTIPLEQASQDTEFFLAVGEQCSFLSLQAANIYSQRMQRSGNTNFNTKTYRSAGHILEPPYGPFIHQNYQQYFPFKNASHTIPEVGTYIRWGGTPEGNSRAQEQMWQDMQEYVYNEVQGKSPWYQQYLSHNVRQYAQ